MTVKEFKEVMICNEPDFEYNNQLYSICSPDGKYYVTASDSPGDLDLEFISLDDLFDKWIIQGLPFREILPDIQLNN